MNQFIRLMIKKKAGIMFCLFYCLLFQARPQSAEAIHRQILQLRLDRADQLLTSPQQESSPYHFYLKSLSLTARILITEDQSVWENNKQLHAQWIDAIEELPKDAENRSFWLAELSLHRGLIHLQLGEELTGGWHFWKAFHMLERHHQVNPDHLPGLKSLGFLHLILGNIPPKFQWIANMIGLKGDVKTGLEELKLAASQPHLFQKESQLLLYTVQAYILQEQDAALNGLEKWQSENPDNLLAAYLYASVLMKSAQTERAIPILHHLTKLSDGHISFPFVYYLKGQALLQKGEYKASLKTYRQFIEQTKGLHHIKDATYKMAIANHLLEQQDSARFYLQKARGSGGTFSEADRYAARMLEKKELVQPVLYQLRYFTDGGYYAKADALIDTVNGDSFNFHEQIEWAYRCGRLEQQKGETQKALAKYRSLLRNTKRNSADYFLPNAALQSAYLYREIEEMDSAACYFQKALKYKDYPYESSISRKAEAGLKALK